MTKRKSNLTFKTFSIANRVRCESHSGFNHSVTSWSTSDWFLAILGELGEAANIAKKLNRSRDGVPGNKESDEILREKLRREVADIFVYLDLVATHEGFDLEQAVKDVWNAKSEQIGYHETL